MFKFLFLISTVFIFKADALGADFKTPFAPVYASEQNDITATSLLEERKQFRFFALWRVQKDQLITQGLRLEDAKKDYARIKELFDKGKESDFVLRAAKNTMDGADLRFKRIESEIQQTIALAELAKLRVLNSGNSDQDHRKEIALSIKKETQAALKTAQLEHKRFKTNQSFRLYRLNAGKKLFKEKVISRVDLEARKLAYQEASELVNSAKYQETSAKEALEAVEKSLKRL